jgi:hypothetical protein
MFSYFSSFNIITKKQNSITLDVQIIFTENSYKLVFVWTDNRRFHFLYLFHWTSRMGCFQQEMATRWLCVQSSRYTIYNHLSRNVLATHRLPVKYGKTSSWNQIKNDPLTELTTALDDIIDFENKIKCFLISVLSI